MSENDLILSIAVLDSDNKTTASFKHNLNAVEPEAVLSISDALSPGELFDGNYKVTATITQGDLELSSDSAEFTVIADVTSFTGKLYLADSTDKSTADFSVKNTGNTDATDAIITVTIYKDGNSEPVYTYTDTVSIAAGETFTGNTSFDLSYPTAGKYSGVLSIDYKNDISDLDYDGFENTYETTTITTTITTSNRTSTSSSATTTTIAATSNPKTGDSGIPIYMWLISTLSLLGLVSVKLMGGKENE